MPVLPSRGVSFIEFSLVFSPIRDQLAWTQLADDFLQAKELLFMGSSIKPISSYVFAVQDKSSGTTSSFSLSVQMSVKSSKADSLALFVRSSLSDFLEAMKRKFDIYLSKGAGAVMVWNLARTYPHCGYTFPLSDPLFGMIVNYPVNQTNE